MAFEERVLTRIQCLEKKSKYLISQANAFINSDQFEQAIKTAKYIISNLDKNSVKAKSIVEKGKPGIEAIAKKKTEELKKKIGNFGK